MRSKHPAAAAETFAPERSSRPPVRGSRPPASPGSPRPASRRSRARAGRASPSSSTGSELVQPGEPLGPGQIYESNALMLAAALAVAGAEIVGAPSVPDDEASLREALERGLECDVLVTSGGVSVGEHDLVREVERELGVEESFWRVAIKPGKPLAFGTRGNTLVFGLPGNPVSALVGAELFVKPALRALQGIPEPLPRFEPGRLGSELRRNPERDEFVRARTRNDRRRGGARAATRSGVAHDRERERCRRTRPHSTWKRRAHGRRGRFVAPPERSMSAARRRCARTSVRISSRSGPRGGASPERDTAHSGSRRARRAVRRRRAPRVRSRRVSAARTRRRRVARCTTAHPSRARSARRTSRRDTPGRRGRATGRQRERAARRACTCGSQSQKWRHGRRKTSAYGFVAATSRPTTDSASRAAVWPASSSSVRKAGAESDGRGGRASSRRSTSASTSSAPTGHRTSLSGAGRPSVSPRKPAAAKRRKTKPTQHQNARRLR